jgi:hypothetical protein
LTALAEVSVLELKKKIGLDSKVEKVDFIRKTTATRSKKLYYRTVLNSKYNKKNDEREFIVKE